MTKSSHSTSDLSSVESRSGRVTAVLCPAVCALLLVCIFAASFVGAKLAYERYDAFCAARRFDVAKLYIFPNVTITKN